MKKIILAAGLLVATTLCEAKNCCLAKINTINCNAQSLKVQCETIQQIVDDMLINCCGGGGDACPCAPTPITELTSTITASGCYCLAENVTAIDVTTDAGVVVDLNSFTANSVTLGDNCIVKNGVVNMLVPSANALAQGVYISSVFGDGVDSSVVLIDVAGLTSLNNVERVVMARCTGDGSSLLMVAAGVKEVTLYDSLFPWLRVTGAATDFERLAVYRSTIDSNLEFYNADSLQEFVCYQSVIGGEIQRNGLMQAFERFSIEESQVGRLAFFLDVVSTQTLNGSVQRSVFKDGMNVQGGIGLFVRNCEMAGPVGLNYDNNVHIDNVSVTSNTAAISIADATHILLTDCCTTASWVNGEGYRLSFPYSENVTILRCFAKGCYNGFNLGNSTSCLAKDCVCDGAANYSFLAGDDVVGLGNVALSVSGVPATNFTGALFDPVVVAAPSVSTDDADKSIWRNMSFEL